MKRFLHIPLLISAVSAESVKLPDLVDFNDHIQPILSENCYHCHGPDSSTREPKKNPLRLDREEYAFKARANGKPVIIKGDPDASKFIKVLTDVDNIMPPSQSHKDPLKPEQVALFRKWVKQDAPYEEHWAFIKPKKSAVPSSSWGNNAIDSFIAAEHQEKHLTPNNPAPAHRILRRLTFDITGLPPTIKELTAFEKAHAVDSKTAIQNKVAQLLKSDGYAENFARHWLDAARYADTHGIHIDNYRSIWPYRDWVIEAFRQNKSFKDFTIEQIAGDLLPEATIDQKVATGFNRCLPTTGEGGAIDKEYEAIYATDRVETTSAIWLGLTTGCAACHDHKFDPISQKDFYSLAAYFRNTTMKAMDGNDAKHAPTVFIPRKKDKPELNAIPGKLEAIDQKMNQRKKMAGPDFEAWLNTQDTNTLPTQLIEPASDLPLVVMNQKITGTIDGQERTWNFPHGTKSVEKIGKVTRVSGKNIKLGDVAIFDARDQVSFSAHILVDHNTNGALISRLDVGQQFRGWDIWIENGHLAMHIIDEWPNKAIKAVTKSRLKRQSWNHIVITYDGEAAPKKSLTFYVNGKTVPFRYIEAGKVNTIQTKAPTRLGARHPNSRIQKEASIYGFQFFRNKLTADEIKDVGQNIQINKLLALPAEQRNQKQKEVLFNYYVDAVDAPSNALQKKKDTLLNRRDKLRSKAAVSLVMQEKKGTPFAHILDRGDYSLPKKKVFANIPELFQKKEQTNAKQNRKQLAEWLVSDDNPLSARVTVNRIWYYFFGRGLVETTEDFGIMGARPTHPELLDYLAVEFVESGWDTQHIIKLITSSATYQQDGKVTSDSREKDPTNLYLARSPRHRMEAEQLRDMALASSGLLKHKIGGPPVKPYQPEGIWEAVAMKQSNTKVYKQDEGDALYRRSIYTFWKRTAPHPSMEILNAPTREVFCVRRDRTNTPLQAFVTLNDTQFVEAARKLAEEALKLEGDFNGRLNHLTRALMGRVLKTDERKIVEASFKQLEQHYQSHPDLAAKLLTVGQAKPDPSLDPQELAPWTVISSQIFNLDETLTK